MSYSFIKPKLKPIFSIFSKIWIAAILIVTFFLVCADLFIKFETYSLKKQNDEKQVRYDKIFAQISNLKSEMKTLMVQRDAALDIYSSNNILKKSLHNLFDLVPDAITLNDVYIDTNSLIVKGLTPTKDVYKLLLEAPLKSIFNSSSTTFYQLENGWFNFVSINKMDNLEVENEKR
ncbi:hypothetical protein [Campylobacter fetus]|uniref:Membrane protein n=1 Tax=Campylobacter fetus subsp. testudinum TaxID=1507806 RepID=A0AAX0HCY3_CAMFE|nr:hypothetical protein [Campylobacter fetus]AGZ82183.1 hypothetical protein CFT03427_1337 [Campylobacter fetus subsp. testudinum 03-427]AJB45911.1 membrane protein [Campylobacter fetus subsp. testudinum]ALV65353.1 hypothetical protein CFTSP3_1400 [Campylobacter fetus subsp. testudinum Sp3]EAI4322178.1 hypothetical protein [Campylobacter fetus]EAI4391812.1 hypothetical protein [Campylobacter fetus]